MKIQSLKLYKFLAIDPGLNGTGWTVFQGNNYRFLVNGVINIRGKEDWDARAMSIAYTLANIAEANNVKKVFIEYPAYFDSVGGQMVAKRGDLLKLTYLVGCISGFLEPIPTVLIPVNRWKGQLPKSVVAERVRKIIGETLWQRLKSHDIDSTGVGLYVQGHMK